MSQYVFQKHESSSWMQKTKLDKDYTMKDMWMMGKDAIICNFLLEKPFSVVSPKYVKGRLHMFIRNSSGPRQQPCRTPKVQLYTFKDMR